MAQHDDAVRVFARMTIHAIRLACDPSLSRRAQKDATYAAYAHARALGRAGVAYLLARQEDEQEAESGASRGTSAPDWDY